MVHLAGGVFFALDVCAPHGLGYGEQPRGANFRVARQFLADGCGPLIVIQHGGVEAFFDRMILYGLMEPLVQRDSFAQGRIACCVPHVGIDALDGPWSGSVHLKSVEGGPMRQTVSLDQTVLGLIEAASMKRVSAVMVKVRLTVVRF